MMAGVTPLDRLALAEVVSQHVIDAAGSVDRATRQAIRDRAFEVAAGGRPRHYLAPAVAAFVDALATGSGAPDLDALQAEGLDDDAALEVAVCAAVGAGRARLVTLLQALEECSP
jgi:alkylhydroperoxidase family enzyme